MSSSHVGIDIREMMRKTASGTMFGDSLTQRNTAPKFNTKLVARPTSRPQRSSEDISFEAEMEREVRARAAHGRRAAANMSASAGSQVFSAAAGGAAPAAAPAAPKQLSNTRTPGTFAATFAHKKEDALSLQPEADMLGRGFGEGSRFGGGGAGGSNSRERGSRGLSSVSRSLDLGSRRDGRQPPPPSDPAGDGPGGLLSIGAIAVNPIVPKGRGTPEVGGGSLGGLPAAAPRARLSASTPAADGPSPTAAMPAPPPPPMSSPARSPARSSGYGQAAQAAQVAPAGAEGGAAAPGGAATGMVRAKEWNGAVENAYRLQEAGYKDEHEARSLGHPPLEYWPPKAPETALIRKLVTRETVQKEAHSTIYFSKARECEDKDLSKVKMYTYD